MRTLRTRSSRDSSVSTAYGNVSSGNSRGSMQTITPEEPGKLEFGLEFPGSNNNNESEEASSSRSHSQSMALLSEECDVMQDTQQHSLKNTRILEIEIAKMVSDLEKKDPRTEEMTKIISLLNRSLSAISHWSLQAQLSHWENRKEKDDRAAVEKDLVKKEAEFFKNKLQKQTRFLIDSSSTSQPDNIPSSLSSPTSKIANLSTFPNNNNNATNSDVLLSPKRVTKQRKLASPRRNESQIHPPTPSQSLKLVENTKPHPRLKRNLNDQTNQGLIRVFHLEKGR